jgi:integrase
MTPSKRYTGVLWRENKSGTKTFYIRYNIGKKNICTPVSATSEKEAFDMRTAKIAELNAAKAEAVATKESGITINRLWNEYVRCMGGPEKVREADRYRYDKYFKDRFGEFFPADINTQVVEKFKHTLVGLAPASVANILELLRRIINFGVKQGLCKRPDNLVFNLPKFDNQKTEMFTEEQTQRYLKALAEEHDRVGATFLHILMLTGMRRSSLCGLLWDDIDFENGTVLLRAENTKNGTVSHLAMSDVVAELFKSLPHTSVWVFPSPRGGHQKSFRRVAERVKKAAGLPQSYRPTYSLRHNFASQLASSGKVDIYTIQRALTHKSIAMTQRYAHLADSAMKRASDIAAEIIQ